jgi:Zn-finger nucleic acid-binding protein
MELTCPKCHGSMRSYERNGVTVDQCTDCRGLFLDRGELDRLIDAENAWHGDTAPKAAPTGPPSAPPAAAAGAGGLGAVVSDVLRQAQSARSGGSHYGSSGHYPKKRKKSFLDEMFG